MAALLLILAVVAFPFYWMLLSAFTPRAVLFRRPYQLVRLDLSLENFRDLLFATEFLVYAKNTVLAAVGAIALNVIGATLAGYGLPSFTFRRKRTCALGARSSSRFPAMLMAIPLYILFSALQMRNTCLGLILANIAISLPLALWIMWQYFQIVPLSLEEAGWVSGASR